MAKFLSVILIMVSLGGCASAVGWGKPYEVVHKTSKSITIHYDPMLSTIADISTIADEHCKKYGKEAVPGEVDGGSYWVPTKNIIFHCE